MGRSSEGLRLKPRAFQILLILADGEQHGWNIVKALQADAPGERILPGSLYRTLNEMTESGLIEALPDEGDGSRRRNLRITPAGIEAVRDEAAKLEELVRRAKSKRLFFPEGSRA